MLFVICIPSSNTIYFYIANLGITYDSNILCKFHELPYCCPPIYSNDFSKHMNEISPTYFFMMVMVLVWWREFVMAVPGAPANSRSNVHRNVSHELSHHWRYFPTFSSNGLLIIEATVLCSITHLFISIATNFSFGIFLFRMISSRRYLKRERVSIYTKAIFSLISRRVKRNRSQLCTIFNELFQLLLSFNAPKCKIFLCLSFRLLLY